MKFFRQILILIFSLLIISCDTKFFIASNGENASFEFETTVSDKMVHFLSAFAGQDISDLSEIFNPQEIQQSLQEQGYSNASVKIENNSLLKIKFETEKKNLSIIRPDGTIAVNKENLSLIYENLPDQFQSYIDMLMIPSFTGEEISDEEYLDVIASVYGNEISDELKNATIRIQGKKIKLLELFNFSEELIF